MVKFKGKEGRWITSKGRHIFIEDGQSFDDAIKAYDEAAEAKRLLNADVTNEGDHEAVRAADDAMGETISGCQSLISSRALPPGIEPAEMLGGTMDTSGKPVDMRKFKDGYLVSCGNASDTHGEENRKFLLSEEGKRFIKEFVDRYSDDGVLYVGSWYQGGNTNEPTIWVKDRGTAMRLAKLTGQWSITDCVAYNRHKCENYKLLNEEQSAFADDIFIETCKKEEHERAILSEVKWE